MGGSEGQRVSDAEGSVVEPAAVLQKPGAGRGPYCRGRGGRRCVPLQLLVVVAHGKQRFPAVPVNQSVSEHQGHKRASIAARPEGGWNRESLPANGVLQSGNDPEVEMLIEIRIRPAQPVSVGAPANLSAEGREHRRRGQHRHRGRGSLPVRSEERADIIGGDRWLGHDPPWVTSKRGAGPIIRANANLFCE